MKEVCVKDDMLDCYALDNNKREDLLAYGFKIFEIEDQYVGLCDARDFDENGFNVEKYNKRVYEFKLQMYDELIVNKIRKRYSINQELAILRQRDTKPDEFTEYNSYVEQCKVEVKEELKNGN